MGRVRTASDGDKLVAFRAGWDPLLRQLLVPRVALATDIRRGHPAFGRGADQEHEVTQRRHHGDNDPNWVVHQLGNVLPDRRRLPWLGSCGSDVDRYADGAWHGFCGARAGHGRGLDIGRHLGGMGAARGRFRRVWSDRRRGGDSRCGGRSVGASASAHCLPDGRGGRAVGPIGADPI